MNRDRPVCGRIPRSSYWRGADRPPAMAQPKSVPLSYSRTSGWLALESGSCAIGISRLPSIAWSNWRIPETEVQRSITQSFMKNYFLLLVSFAASILPVRAQVSSGSLLGDARDEKGAFVPGVAIQARSSATGFTRTATTNSFGSYRIDDLLPGSYTVTAQHEGFQAKSMSVMVEVNQKARVDFELHLGWSLDTVTVTAHAPPLQTDEASEGYLLGG